MLDRRAVVSSAAAFAGLAATATLAEANEAPGTSADTKPRDSCIDLCLASHRQCLSTASYLIGNDRTPASKLLIPTLLDCAELCQATANSMIRNSPQHMLFCDACAQLCETCAESCQVHGEDIVLRNCAAVCRTCALVCRDMARMPM